MQIDIEVFTVAGCGKCSRAAVLMEEIIIELDAGQVRWQLVDVVENIDRAVELGVLATPAIAINSVLAFTGMPTKTALLREIEQVLKTSG